MATKKEGGKNRKIGRHSRNPSSAGQAKRTERNKAARAGGQYHVPPKAPRLPGLAWDHTQADVKEWHAMRRREKMFFIRREIKAEQAKDRALMKAAGGGVQLSDHQLRAIVEKYKPVINKIDAHAAHLAEAAARRQAERKARSAKRQRA